MRTHVYVDGFNFYYGCIKGMAYKWLHFGQLFGRLLPTNDIRAIKYFTARVDARPNDPDKSTRYSQLPNPVLGPAGPIHKPPTW